MIFWPLLFIASYPVEPYLKLRSSRKTSSADQQPQEANCKERPTLDPALPMPRDWEALEEGKRSRTSDETQRYSPPFVASSSFRSLPLSVRVHGTYRVRLTVCSALLGHSQHTEV